MVLDKEVEDYFINKTEKNLLLIVQLQGIPHVGGLYHAYLGIFDKTGNLLTPSSTLFSQNMDDNFEVDTEKSIHFGADDGEFNFYDCNGIKYILFSSEHCTTGGCDGGARLMKYKNNKFEIVQNIGSVKDITRIGKKIVLAAMDTIEERENSIKVVPQTDKVSIYRKKIPIDTGSESFIFYKDLNWNKNTCKFE